MDRIVEVKVNGTHVWKDSQYAGVQGEVNATYLRIEFDEGWDGFAKTITWWDAKGENPTSRVLTAAELEDITASTRIYLTPIVPEALAIWGKCMFSIDGYINGRRQRSAYASMVVKPKGNGEDITIEEPTPSQIEQLQVQIDTLLGDISAKTLDAATSEQNAKAYAEGGYVTERTDGGMEVLSEVPGAKAYMERSRVYVEGGTFPAGIGGVVTPVYIDGAANEAAKAQAYAESGTYEEWVYDASVINEDGSISVIRGWSKQIKTVDKGAKQHAKDAELYANRAEAASKLCGGTVELDTTLTKSGKAADAKAVGDALSKLSGGKVVGTSIGEKCAKFSSLMNGKDKVESFVFFADPHLAEASGYEARMQEYLETIRTYYYGIPASFVLCGGDWIGNSDTRDNACFKLGYIDGLMRRHFDRFYHVVGNHDTNQQGVDETGGVWTGLLSRETVRNLWFREKGKNYYSFDGANTKFYVLDSWKEGGDASYYWEQIAWLAEKLKSENPDNVAIALHIGFVSSGGVYVTDTLATNVLSLCEAFNNATTITLNGTEYDFTGCTGKVRFALCGHIHDDYVLLKNGIPLIATTNTRAGNTVTFDMCLVDYDTNTMNMVRVGSGSSRTISLTTGEILEDTDDETGSGETINIEYKIGDKIVFLPQVNHQGDANITYNRTVRSLIVSTVSENDAQAFGAVEGTNAVPYYSIAIPDGAVSITVTCPGLIPTVEYTYAGGSLQATSGWLSEGWGSHTIPDGCSYFIVKFKKLDESEFATDYDASGIVVKISSDPVSEDTGDSEDISSSGTVGDKFVFLPRVNHQGGTYLTYEQPTRAVIVSTVSENGASEYGASSGTNAVPYYPIAIPSGKTSITVTYPGLVCAVSGTNSTGSQISDSGWLAEDGGSYDIPAGTIYLILKFKNPDDSAFTADYDASGIAWEFL